MEEPATTLEAAIADCGLLLVELEKLAGHREDSLTTLRAEAMTIGQEARRQHRAGGLDDAAIAASLVDRAHAVVVRARDAVAALRQAPAYRAAVAAHRTGDHAALARLLPTVLEGLEWVAEPPPLYHAMSWMRRNRPLPADEVARHVVQAREAGLPADDDALAPGIDPELPAVPLASEPDGASPVLLRFEPGELPHAVFRLRLSGQMLVHVPVLRAPFDVVLPESLDPDELGEVSLDHPRYRESLVAALGAQGFVARAA